MEIVTDMLENFLLSFSLLRPGIFFFFFSENLMAICPQILLGSFGIHSNLVGENTKKKPSTQQLW